MPRAVEWYVIVPALPVSDVFGPFPNAGAAAKFRSVNYPDTGRLVESAELRPRRQASA